LHELHLQLQTGRELQQLSTPIGVQLQHGNCNSHVRNGHQLRTRRALRARALHHRHTHPEGTDRMTDRPATHRLCPVCANAFCPATQARCDDCGLAHTANRTAPTTPTKHQRAKPRVDISQGLPEDLSGYEIEDFLP
jgi:hypothetical protein